MSTPHPIPDPPVVAYVPGCWDLLHAGHVSLLWRAHKLCDVLVVGVVSDAGVEAYKGRLPVQDENTRLMNIGQLSFVDVVELQATTDPTPQLERFRPHAVLHGDDWRRLKVGHETLKRLDIEYVMLPYTPGISTTQLREMAVC